ncbi:MAG: endonuclease MutS2 [Lachnospiraceae bacterium]|nr:endonuclease MutS2 [Lachnospiraceae bacterium]
MNEKSLRVLEFHKIIDMLTARATCAPGRALCEKLRPSVVLTTIEQAQHETADALSRILRFGSTSFGSTRDLGGAYLSLQASASLSASELLHIAQFLENVARVKSYGREADGQTADPDTEETGGDVLSHYFEDLAPLTPLSTEIRRCILAEDTIADDASQNLKRIRREVLTTGDKIHAQLLSMVNGSYRTYLQDAVITQRGDRYCIPVKAEYKSLVSGMVHDQSASGSTYFIEPSAVVALNNRLSELAAEERDEIAVILGKLSAQAAEQVVYLKTDQQIMTQLDFIFAKAQLAVDMNATRPIFNEEHRVYLRKARHPLIDAKQVVPIDLMLGKDFDLLVVTGPNTGGKTVSLKTIGLLTLMGQAGLHIPTLDRSELSVFREVYADIGDEQSIEQSLSTFSSHMTNIVQILKHADEHALCLFDELGAGTDPTEGAALAISILDYLHQRGIRSMATTHYSELKVYALSTPFVENACCEFDVESLRPTYRLLIGIPGKSNAFAISSRLGLPDHIIDAAKAQISDSKESFEDLISDLQQSKIKIDREEAEITQLRREAETLKKQLEEKTSKLDARREDLLRDAREEARDILQEAKDYADETIRLFRKAGENTTMRELEQSRQKLHGKISDQNSKISVQKKEQKPAGSSLSEKDIHIGDKVKIVSMGLTGTISSMPDRNGNLFVQCGIMRTQAKLSDLIAVQEETVTGAGTSSISSGKKSGKLRMGKAFSVSSEINLLGLTADEAIMQLDKYLDDAYLAHLSTVRIVHGKGTGVLRKAVQQYLKKCKIIDSYRLGEFGEGDAGVTIATFKG